MSTTTATLEPKPKRKWRKLIWLIPIGGWFLLILPVVLLAGAGNPPCPGPGAATPNATTPAGGPAPGGMFAQPLKLSQGKWYEVGATFYGGPSDPGTGTQGSITTPGQSYLPAHPDSFAELSLLDSNPYPNFTFADANALNNLPYMTGLIVANNNTKKVLYKRDTGYGQGPGQTIANGQPYRLDVWWQSAIPLGVSKNAVKIALAPPLGTGGALGQTPSPTSTAARRQPCLRQPRGQRDAAAHPGPTGAHPRQRRRERAGRRAARGDARDRRRQPHPHDLLHQGTDPGDADHPAELV